MKVFIKVFLIIAFAITISSGLSAAQPEKIRVKVEVVGDHSIDIETHKYITAGLNKLGDVVSVETDPQVYVHVIARKLVTNRGRRLGYVMGTASSEIIEISAEGGDAMIFSDYNGLWVEMGPNLRALSNQCVTAINSGVLQRIRKVE